ncbi:sulfur carrier protein ThiS [Cytobacillus purgationiresistens]|uniref:Sulfur carrier protein n=1 Tax=Cytobacillus purgationiresistens TaxID=863449 RepID=A0ABU0ABI1_9BACI|nr:sulfur carrier protein ThiS [Cytobacillus purgationiresistens]MDQ0268234.1 sulfur carrier protein [Cytobacillus purgationiresistens]
MNLVVNGNDVNIPDSVQTVLALLNHFQLENKIVIVEINHSIINKSLYEETNISDGDHIEIVHFVGGG